VQPLIEEYERSQEMVREVCGEIRATPMPHEINNFWKAIANIRQRFEKRGPG
jgi:hypothetical protein